MATNTTYIIKRDMIKHYVPPVVLRKKSNLNPSQSLGPATNLQELGELFMNMQSANPNCEDLYMSNEPGSSR